MPRRATLVETRPTGNGRARGLVSSRASGRRIDARTFAPAPDLADVVATYWTGAWDLRGQVPHVTELLSDPCVNLVFETGERHAGGRLVGVWTRLWRRTLEGLGRVRGVKLRAGAVRAFVPAPAVRFANRIVSLETALGIDMEAVERDVLGSDDDAEGFGAFEEFLYARRLESEREETSLAVALVDRIRSDADITTVEHLSEVAGMGVRALQRLFRDHVGASPKWVIRRNRLQEVAVRLERREGASVAALAAELGYTDQAHLARDFKSVVGRSPREFLRACGRDSRDAS